jgi:hypothetical protein
MPTRIIAVSLAAAATLAAGSSAQVTQPRPGPGSGVVTVSGTVDIGRMPVATVNAAQQGEWRVTIASMPQVVVAPVAFVKAGGRYVITWPNGETQAIRIAQVGPGGWVKVADTRERWLNLTTAREIEVAP